MADQNADASLAQTQLAILMDLMAQKAPTPVSAIKARHYQDPTTEAARKRLGRVKNALEEAGAIINESKCAAGTAWSLDPASYPDDLLAPAEAQMVYLLCEPLLYDSGFAHRADLRIALMKLGSFPQKSSIPDVIITHDLEMLAYCLNANLLVSLDYEDAEGNLSHRVVAPLGFFDLRGHTYLVCDTDIDDPEAGIRTLRCDRISHATKTSTSFVPPEDFDVNEYRRLPFQLGKPVAQCTFAVPEDARQRLSEATLGAGRVYTTEEGTFWEIPAASLDDAASWAIAHELIPKAPEGLVMRWRELLRGCLA